MLSRRRFLFGCLGAAAGAVSIGWYEAGRETHDVEVVRRVVRIPRLPRRLDGLTAVQISDLHLGEVGEAHYQMVRAVEALEPELVAVTGDLVEDEDRVGAALDLLRPLKPPRGIWAVPGNWDHSADAVTALRSELQPANVRFLINAHAQIDEGFWLVGVDDPATQHDDLPRAVAGVPASAPRVLLAHSPHIVRAVRQTPFDLILVGHTHGGQINLPLLSGAWLHHRANRRYIQGFYDVQGSPLYVNRGIGTTTVPLRIGARPEVTHFTFRTG